MKRRVLTATAIMAALLSAGGAQPPQAAPGSPEAAHQFLVQFLPGRGWANHWTRDDPGYNDIFKINFTEVSSSRCRTSLTGTNYDRITGHHIIYWDKITQISQGYRNVAGEGYYIELSGSIDAVKIYGTITTDKYEIFVPDHTSRQRLHAAMEVIRNSCDRTTNLGF